MRATVKRNAFHNDSSVAALVLVRYGELALKSTPVRREFEQTLRRNILDQFVAAGLSCRLRSDRGHLYVEAADAAPAIALLRRVFGVTSVSEVEEVPTDRDAIRAAALRQIDPLLTPAVTFAIRARRTGQHPFTSQQLAGELGGDVLTHFADRAPRVDLDTPQVELFVEVRDARTYLSTTRSVGPGGLPLGVAGQVAALVDGTRGALGAYLMMKRGCRCAIVPTDSARSLVDDVLRRFDPKARVSAPLPGAVEATDALLAVATSVHADAVVLPLGVEEYPAARARWGERLVYSPTVGFTDEEVASRWLAVTALAS
jgi:thiamine biosynthesis protein ThiI